MDLPVYKPTKKRAPFGVYFSTVFVLFFCTLSAADSIGFVPCAIDDTCLDPSVKLSDLPQLGESYANLAESFTVKEQTKFASPTHIQIGTVGIDLPVQNPDTKDLAVLDELLKQGPARYVDSAQLGEDGNLIIFAHSSHLPIVHNQMYKAFNKLPELKEGDSISLTGNDGKEYLYSVTSVAKADVSDTKIDLSKKGGARLTLVTCDTLTGKSARFIVEAEFVGTI